MILQALVVGLLMAAGEVVNGNFRVRYLQRKLGREKGKKWSFLSGLLIIFIIAWLFFPWINPQSLSQCFQVGLLWVFIMLLLDLYFGRFVLKLSWEKILDDFNPLKGNLLGVGMVCLFFSPAMIFLLFPSKP